MQNEDIRFIKFNAVAQLNAECVIMEKIDGVGTQVMVSADGKRLWLGSDRGWLSEKDDPHGFHAWGMAAKEDLLKLGAGRHYGVWWGIGINREYNVKDRNFSLLDAHRWATERPACCGVVPVLCTGPFSTGLIKQAMNKLRENGSLVAKGFEEPLGVVVYHTGAQTAFQLEYPDGGKHGDR